MITNHSVSEETAQLFQIVPHCSLCDQDIVMVVLCSDVDGKEFSSLVLD